MSDREISAYPSMAALEARRESTLWSPGLRLMQDRGHRVKGLLLLLLSWLAILLLAMLTLNSVGAQVPTVLTDEGLLPIRRIAESAWSFIHRGSPAMVGVALLAVLYLAVCAWMSLADPTHTSLPGAEGGVASPELQGPRELADEVAADMQAHRGEAGARRHPMQDVYDTHLALQLSSQQVGAAIGETARRTISLCGAFDACSKQVDVAGADLEAVQDESAHTQQLIASLRENLLTLGGHCQALGSTAQRMAGSGEPSAAAPHIDELLDLLRAQIVHCHQLSERIGSAERSSLRRIDSIRRCIDSVGHQADRGLREGHQVMVLTRQIEASLAEGSQWLEELGGVCTVPDLRPSTAES